MPNLQKAAYEFNRSAKELEKASAVLRQKMEAQYKTIDQITKQTKQIHFFVAQKLTGKIRRLLNANWGQSGLVSRSGKLKSAAIDGAMIEVTAGGIKITFGASLGKQIYVQGASLNYGSVRGGHGVNARTKARIKKASLKSNAEGGSLGAVKVEAPHPFFYLSPEQVSELQDEYVKLWQQELNRRLGKGKASASR
jgi:hypothetical protein